MSTLFDERCMRLRACQGVLRRLKRESLDRRIVAMGVRVRTTLQRHGIPHLAVVHPAARGTIRRRACYQAHVRSVLEGSLSAKTLRYQGHSARPDTAETLNGRADHCHPSAGGD